jgi:hypothetical protein
MKGIFDRSPYVSYHDRSIYLIWALLHPYYILLTPLLYLYYTLITPFIKGTFARSPNGSYHDRSIYSMWAHFIDIIRELSESVTGILISGLLSLMMSSVRVSAFHLILFLIML